MKVFNISGQLIMQENKTENYAVISMDNFANGTYIVRISADNFYGVKVFEVAR
ncbi:MAG: T9SS type A sorting domain-containing protein [Chitinophagales bacterium]